MPALPASTRDRLTGAALSLAIQAALLYALIAGLAVKLPDPVAESLKLFALAPDPPPPPPEKIRPHPVRSPKREGAASPPNLRAKATAIVAPPPILPPPVPPPVLAATKPGTGTAPYAGAAPIRGPGTGSGGVGEGTGSGNAGDGDGAGGEETAPRWRKGRIRDSDYPREADDAGAQGTVGVRYLVATNGRVTDCDITRSSGSAILDAATCRLIRERFRFDPSRDAAGRPVPATIVENHTWEIEREPAP